MKILQNSYADGRYSIHYGSEDTELGRFTLATDAGGTISAADDTGVDLMRGSTGVDTFDGKGGNDRLYGFVGNDILRGGDGDDVLVGSDGTDTLDGGAGADRLFGGNDGDTLEGGAGADLVNGGDGADTASYASSADTDGDSLGVTVNLLTGDTSGDDAEGDTLVNIENLLGSTLDDKLTGDAEANTLTGGDGADTLRGGAGIDTLQGGEGTDTLYGGADIDTLQGGDGVDTLYGGAGNDFLEGGAGKDIYVFGGTWGTDTIRGETENTDGGELWFRDATGIDSFRFSIDENNNVIIGDRASDNSVKILQAAYAGGRYSISYGADDAKAELDNLYLGTSGDDTLTGGNDAALFFGFAGSDTLTGGDEADTLYGGGGNDFLEGGAGADNYIFTGNNFGADTIRSDADGGNLYFRNVERANDFDFSSDANGNWLITLDGGSVTVLSPASANGNDIYNVHYGAEDTSLGRFTLAAAAGGTVTAKDDQVQDLMQGSTGVDIFDGKGGDDTLYGDAGNDILRGGDGDDVLYGEEGDDTLYGGAGSDILRGGDDSDTLEGGTGGDVVNGGAGADTASYASSLDTDGDGKGVTINLFRGETSGDDAEGDTLVNIENLLGSTLDDNLRGDAGANTLTGGEGADMLYGLAGIDTLQGGGGADTLYGGADNDFLEGGEGADVYVFGGSWGTDTIRDDADGGLLHFRSVTDFNDLRFSTDRNGDVLITYDGNSVKILQSAYAGGRYSLSYGIGDAETSVGKLHLGTSGIDTLTGVVDAGGNDVDLLLGLAGADTLTGGAGSDILEGGAGADTLTGGAGSDILEGGAGADTYVFGGAWGADIIRNDADGGNLYFKGATFDSAIGDTNLAFSRTGRDTTIAIGSDSVTIADFVNGDYELHYGDGDLPLGRLLMATGAGGRIVAADDSKQDFFVGSTGADIFIGKDGNDRLYGGEGDDRLIGEGGSDYLYGGAGNDIFVGGVSTDTLVGGAGADTYIFRDSHGFDFIRGDESDAVGTVNKLYFRDATGRDDFSFSDNGGNARVTVGGATASILQSSYADGLYSIHYGTGNTLLGRFSLAENAGGETITATDDNEQDWMIGLDGIDTLQGLGGDDVLEGGAGADILEGGAGDDILEGGAGTDDYLFGSGSGADTIRDDADGGNLYFKGASAASDVVFSRNADGNAVATVGGDSVTILPSAADSLYDVYSYDTQDTLLGKLKIAAAAGETLGSSEKDLLLGTKGVDTLQGGEGADTLYGDEGNDFLEGGAGADTYVFGGNWGTDTIRGDTDGGTLWFKDAGGVGDLGFSTDENNDVIVRDRASDNSVKILQDAYADGRYGISYGADNIELGKLHLGSTSDETLTGGEDADLMFGFAGVDTLQGEAGEDTLYGHADVDTLIGGEGADTLTGGGGNDFLEGGAGEDIYVFGGRWGTDTIRSDTDGGKLYFKDAIGLGSFDFSRDTEGNLIVGDRASDNAVKILQAAYADGRYSIHYGAENTELGRLALATDAGGALTAADDTSADLMRGSTGVDTFDGKGGNDRLYGFAGDDILRGGDGDDILVGSDGIDTLEGGAGADRLFGGNDGDTLEGGAGADFVNGGAGADTASYANSVDTDGDPLGVTVNLLRGEGSGDDAEGDTLVNVEHLIGSALNDNLRGDTGDNTLTGGEGADSLYGLVGIDTLRGGTGDDRLFGGVDSDFLEGGTGADTYVFGGNWGTDTIRGDTDGGTLWFKDAGGVGDLGFSTDENNDVIVRGRASDNSVKILQAAYADGRYSISYGADNTALGGLSVGTLNDDEGTDKITGTAGDDLLLGLAGSDTLEGGGGVDTLYGHSGIDTLKGGEGADTLYGGGGDDFLEGGAGEDIYVFGGRWGTDTIRGETVDTDGGKLYFKDATGLGSFDFSRDTEGNVIIGDRASDNAVKILQAAYADGRYSIHYGADDTSLGRLSLATDAGGAITAADDTGVDLMRGSTGVDTFDGKGGNDRLYGFAGDDILRGGDGDDILVGSDGIDTLEGGAGADRLFGGNDGDTLEGGEGADSLFGGNDGDTLEGGAGADLVNGGAGADTASYANSVDTDGDGKGVTVNLFRGSTSGDDAVGDSFVSIENLLGSALDDNLRGDTGDNTLTGGEGVDSLYGLAGIDTLQGGAGDDRLFGGEDNDFLEGGAGRDTYVFGGNWGTDTIRGETDGGILWFKDATGIGDLGFSTDENNDVIVKGRASDNSVKILQAAYADGRYSISYGADNTQLGGLSVGTLNDDEGTDKITGTAGDDLLLGLAGSDTLEGGGGVDTLYGHSGIDTLKGGEGVDTLYGGVGDDFLEGGAGEDIYVFGGRWGTDTIRGETANTNGGKLYFKDATALNSFDFSRDTEGNVIIGDRASDNAVKILQAAYADGRYSIHYGADDTSLGRLSLATDAGGAITAADDTGVDLMRGSTGVDTFDGKGGNDRLYGFAGDDILRGGDGDDILVGSDGIDTLEGGAGADRLFGGNDGDMLYGGEGADSLYGGNDGDTLEGGAGADLVNGGAGADTASYANSVDTDGDGKGVTVNLFRGSTSGDDAVGDSFVSIENLLGSALDDNLRGDTGDNTLTGGEGVDSLYGLAGIDTLQGGAGDDRLFGGEDNDFLEGGAGRDTYVFGGNWGTDTIRGETDGGILWFKDATGIGDLGFSTDENNDVIVKGRASDNSVKILQAAYADGRYSISYGADNTQLGGLSVGTLNDDEGTDKITGTAGDDLLLGLAGSDTLEGGGGVDTLYGHSGIDTLKGGEGVDTLYGGVGDDFLEGGAGEDIYVFGGRWGTDTIRGETANTNGGKLYFKDATALNSFDFSRDDRRQCDHRRQSLRQRGEDPAGCLCRWSLQHPLRR